MNPFRAAIVGDPWEQQQGDVPSIHHAVFQKCLEGIEVVRASRHSAALLIHGEAGSGKTHLLSRLRAELTPRAPTATDRAECLYVWVRLQTSPRMIWRTLRRRMVNDWFRAVDGHRSQFDRILFRRFAEVRVAEGDLEPWHEYMLDEDPTGLQALIEQIADKLELDRNTKIAFEHLAFGRHRRDLQAWLSGDSLPEAALARLDLTLDEGTDEEREDEARRIVLMLCRLAVNDLPVVICFDQVEALQTVPDDVDGLFAFGKLVSTLHDSVTNALIVSCVQSAFATAMKDHIRTADYDRMTSLGALSLDPLNRQQASDLIQARLDAAFADDAAARSGVDDRLLTESELDELFDSGRPITPRRLLGLCAERYDRLPISIRAEDKEMAAPEASTGTSSASSTETNSADFLRETWDATFQEKLAENTASQTEEIVRHALPMVLARAAPDLKLASDEQLPDVSLLYERGSERIGVSICTQANMNSLSARLRRLRSQFTPPRLARLVLIRDTRSPLSPGAKKAREYLDDLERQGAIVVHPPVDVLAALDTLRDLMSDAKSGDLAHGAETVRPETVEEWLLAHLPEGLRRMVDEIVGTDDGDEASATDVSVVESLTSLLAEHPLLPLQEAATTLQQPESELEAIIRRHPEQFGLMGDAGDAVLFRVVATPQAGMPENQ